MAYFIKGYCWHEVRDQLGAVNPILMQLIDDLDPGSDFTFYVSEYAYGDVVDDGCFNIQSDQGLVNLSEIDAKHHFVSDLCYSQGSIPASVVLSGSAELFMDTGTKVMTKRLYNAGDVFAFHRKLDGAQLSLHPLNLMCMTAGVRSLFMLPHIGDNVNHMNLRKAFGIGAAPPKTMMEHWAVFKEIANHPQQGTDWRLKLLLFSKKWLDKLNGDDPLWDALRVYLYKQVWQQNAFWRNKIFYDYNFSLVQHSRNLKPNPYLMDTLKHLLAVIVSALPGFSPALNDDCAPISFLKRIYKECYQLKDYAPHIMCPAFFNEGEKSLFYSLQFPTTLVFSPKSTQQASTIQQLRELQHLCTTVFNEFMHKDFGLSGTLFEEILKTHQLNFFHNKADASSHIKASSTVPHYDDKFSKDIDAGAGHFAESSVFWRGCIQLATCA